MFPTGRHVRVHMGRGLRSFLPADEQQRVMVGSGQTKGPEPLWTFHHGIPLFPLLSTTDCLIHLHPRNDLQVYTRSTLARARPRRDTRARIGPVLDGWSIELNECALSWQLGTLPHRQQCPSNVSAPACRLGDCMHICRENQQRRRSNVMEASD